jgi:hypothetical protein
MIAKETPDKTSLCAGWPDGIVGAFASAVGMHARALISFRRAVILLGIVALGAACSLNPQPLPPDTEPATGADASPGGGNDTGTTGSNDASLADSGAQTSLDAGPDTGTNVPPDAGLASDAEIDAETDGGDANVADANEEAGDGGADDGESDAFGGGD